MRIEEFLGLGVRDLRKHAADRNIEGRSKMNKSRLQAALQPLMVQSDEQPKTVAVTPQQMQDAVDLPPLQTLVDMSKSQVAEVFAEIIRVDGRKTRVRKLRKALRKAGHHNLAGVNITKIDHYKQQEAA